MVTRTVTATARVAGRNIVHTVSAVDSDGNAVKVYRPTRRSAGRYAFAKIRWITVDGERAVVVDGWTNTNRARADQARVPVRWESIGAAGENIVPGASVTSRGHSGAGQPEVSGVVERMERDEAIVRTIDGKIRRRSARNLRRVD